MPAIWVESAGEGRPGAGSGRHHCHLLALKAGSNGALKQLLNIRVPKKARLKKADLPTIPDLMCGMP
jgi:hypothetical protein